jgi:hypothetical protein
MKRPYVIALVAVVVLVGSFLTTLWLLGPGTPQEVETARTSNEAAVLAAYLVPDEKILSAAAKAAGLQPSDNIRGYIDNISRLSNDEVKINGWAADLAGQGKPITILVFADGKNVLLTQTKGVRLDVANSLKLPDAAATNVAFEGLLSCRARQALFVVAVTKSNSYAALGHAPGPILCPL